MRPGAQSVVVPQGQEEGRASLDWLVSADATSKKKLQLLGMIHDEDAMMTNKRGETRTLARTKYMDGLSGEDLGRAVGRGS